MKKIKYLFTISLILMTFGHAEKIRIVLPIEIKDLDPIDVSYVEEYEVFTNVYYRGLAYVGNLADQYRYNHIPLSLIYNNLIK